MDFDDAYANAKYIQGSAAYPDAWALAAREFRATALCELDVTYGASPRQKLDLFLPQGPVRGLVVFVHGGYWLRFDKSYWSHLAAGPLGHGWAVAMPSYDLCPDVSVPQIGSQVAAAIAKAAELVEGPISLVGHSAGGQLVARMPSLAKSASWLARLCRIVSISPVADLGPLMKTAMNAELGLTQAQVASESPVQHSSPAVPVTVWVGAQERPVFVDQARSLGAAWACDVVVAPDKHHFDVIDGLADAQSDLVAEICASRVPLSQ